MPSMPPPGRGCPGPGQYGDVNGIVNRLKNRSDFLQGKNTAVFAESVPEAVSSKLKNLGPPVPGPGSYAGAIKHHSKPNINGAVASFKSSSKRGEAGSEQGDNPATMPGPGEYYSQKPILPPTGSGHEGLNAVFQEQCERHYAAVHRDLPVASAKARKALGDFASVVAK